MNKPADNLKCFCDGGTDVLHDHYPKPDETMLTRFRQKWTELTENDLNLPSWTSFLFVGVYAFLEAEIAREQNRFLSQPANQHDNEVRRVERERLLPIIAEITINGERFKLVKV